MRLLSKKLVISNMPIKEQSTTIISLYDDQKPMEIRLCKEEETGLLGNIYVGKVKNIVENIQAAFIEIENGYPCYYSIEQEGTPIFTNSKKDNKLRVGDELLVQVQREALKTKVPCVTGNLSFTGKYLVLTTSDKSVGLSKKLSNEEKARLKKWIEPMLDSKYGFIIRTNAAQASKEEIMKEAMFLIQRFVNVSKVAFSRPCFTLIDKAPSSYITALRDTYVADLEKIITDDKKIYEELKEYLSNYQKEDSEKLHFYQDEMLSLDKLYRLEMALKEATSEKVWLKSGGFLVIQQTEACVVIDVNTGKFIGKKKIHETYRKINHEAAVEIARQLRLRNLSGIILIDFINMESKEHDEELVHVLQKYVRRDPIVTKVMGLTRLKIMEVTRKKVRKSLLEQMNELTMSHVEE